MKVRSRKRVWCLLLIVALAAAACSGTGGEMGRSDQPETGVAGAEKMPDVSGWHTDWSKRTIDLRELVRGLDATDPRDVIPPLDNPGFESVDEASRWLDNREPVAAFDLGGHVRAYPLRILTWHEIVNDEFEAIPVAVTYCPLCNSAVAFKRMVNGQVLRFGTSGLLRNSDLVMWDRQTESLWQQVTGEAIVGDLAGTHLDLLPVSIISWKDFREHFPRANVLSRNTGYQRNYGSNPYLGYDSQSQPFLFNGKPDPRYPAMERLVGVSVNRTNKAYPFSVISRERAVNDVVADQPIAVLWGSDTASALDSSNIPEGRGVGTGVAYFRTVDGQTLTFQPLGDGLFADTETGSTWDLLGNAVSGLLAGKKLTPVIHTNHFWFAWAAFNPDSPVYTGAAAGVPASS